MTCCTGWRDADERGRARIRGNMISVFRVHLRSPGAGSVQHVSDHYTFAKSPSTYHTHTVLVSGKVELQKGTD